MQGKEAPLGQKILLSGRVLDEDGKPVRNTLVEIWQANAAGRYRHLVDNHAAPIDAITNRIRKARAPAVID